MGLASSGAPASAPLDFRALQAKAAAARAAQSAAAVAAQTAPSGVTGVPGVKIDDVAGTKHISIGGDSPWQLVNAQTGEVIASPEAIAEKDTKIVELEAKLQEARRAEDSAEKKLAQTIAQAAGLSAGV
jgi:hypothetical protein